jgi:hypothetical protein
LRIFTKIRVDFRNLGIIYRRQQQYQRNRQQNSLSTAYEHLVKNYFMSVNSNPKESQKNMKKLPAAKFFSIISSVVDTGD